MTNYGEARKIIEQELQEWERSLEHELEGRHDFEAAFGESRYDVIIEHTSTIRGLQRAFRALEVTNHCHCPEEVKTGHTQVNCCNICGMPDEEFWKPEPIKNSPDS